MDGESRLKVFGTAINYAIHNVLIGVVSEEMGVDHEGDRLITEPSNFITDCSRRVSVT